VVAVVVLPLIDTLLVTEVLEVAVLGHLIFMFANVVLVFLVKGITEVCQAEVVELVQEVQVEVAKG
jgi:hypothetical protein